MSLWNKLVGNRRDVTLYELPQTQEFPFHDPKAGKTEVLNRQQFEERGIPRLLDQAKDNRGELAELTAFLIDEGFSGPSEKGVARLKVLDPDGERTAVLQCYLQSLQGKTKEARFQLDRFVKFRAKTPFLAGAEARLAFEVGEFEKGDAILKDLFEMDPNSNQAFSHLIRGSLLKGGQQELKDAMTRLATDPKAFRALLWLGAERLEQKDYRGASDYFDEVLGRGFIGDEIYQYIGSQYLKQQDGDHYLQFLLGRYSPEKQGPANAIHAFRVFLMLGKGKGAQDILQLLKGFEGEGFSEILKTLQNDFDQGKSSGLLFQDAGVAPFWTGQPGAVGATEEGNRQIAFVTVPRPLWMSGLLEPTWIYPENTILKGPRVAFFQLNHRDERAEKQGLPPETVWIRGLPLCIMDRLHLTQAQNAFVLFPMLPNQGPIVFAHAVEAAFYQEALRLTSHEKPDYYVSGEIRTTEDRFHLRLEMRKVEADLKEDPTSVFEKSVERASLSSPADSIWRELPGEVEAWATAALGLPKPVRTLAESGFGHEDGFFWTQLNSELFLFGLSAMDLVKIDASDEQLAGILKFSAEFTDKNSLVGDLAAASLISMLRAAGKTELAQTQARGLLGPTKNSLIHPMFQKMAEEPRVEVPPTLPDKIRDLKRVSERDYLAWIERLKSS